MIAVKTSWLILSIISALETMYSMLFNLLLAKREKAKLKLALAILTRAPVKQQMEHYKCHHFLQIKQLKIYGNSQK